MLFSPREFGVVSLLPEGKAQFLYLQSDKWGQISLPTGSVNLGKEENTHKGHTANP